MALDTKESVASLEKERDAELRRISRRREGGEIGAQGAYIESHKIRVRFEKKINDILSPKK